MQGVVSCGSLRQMKHEDWHWVLGFGLCVFTPLLHFSSIEFKIEDSWTEMWPRNLFESRFLPPAIVYIYIYTYTLHTYTPTRRNIHSLTHSPLFDYFYYSGNKPGVTTGRVSTWHSSCVELHLLFAWVRWQTQSHSCPDPSSIFNTWTITVELQVNSFWTRT